jgi:hypothetical protein
MTISGTMAAMIGMSKLRWVTVTGFTVVATSSE